MLLVISCVLVWAVLPSDLLDFGAVFLQSMILGVSIPLMVMVILTFMILIEMIIIIIIIIIIVLIIHNDPFRHLWVIDCILYAVKQHS